jgi:hypothetical protein
VGIGALEGKSADATQGLSGVLPDGLAVGLSGKLPARRSSTWNEGEKKKGKKKGKKIFVL